MRLGWLLLWIVLSIIHLSFFFLFTFFFFYLSLFLPLSPSLFFFLYMLGDKYFIHSCDWIPANTFLKNPHKSWDDILYMSRFTSDISIYYIFITLYLGILTWELFYHNKNIFKARPVKGRPSRCPVLPLFKQVDIISDKQGMNIIWLKCWNRANGKLSLSFRGEFYPLCASYLLYSFSWHNF